MPHLLEQESRLAWAVDQTLSEGDDLDLADSDRAFGMAVYDAEARKEEACRPLYAQVQRRIDRAYEAGSFSLGARFWSDLSLLGALLVPMTSVERCAAAQRAYREAYGRLQQHLTVHGGHGRHW